MTTKSVLINITYLPLEPLKRTAFPRSAANQYLWSLAYSSEEDYDDAHMRTVARSHKFRRPVLHHYVPRTAILEQLASSSNKPATAVLAPPGYGKTTLISNYTESFQGTSIWYSIDDGDADLASFFHHFSHAIQSATTKGCKSLPNYQVTDGINTKAFARQFFSCAYQRLKCPFIIVFDDIHECLSQKWADAIKVAIDELPVSGHIFLIGRQTLPPELARLSLNQNINFIREEHLRFSDRELGTLASTYHIKRLSCDQINKIQSMMDGWAAGLSLLFSLMKHVDHTALLTLDTKDSIFSYFSNEVLRGLDSEAYYLLLRTCFLPDVSVEHAIALTGNHAAEKILQDLYKKNYFTYRIENSGTVYRYHPMFKSFLWACSKKELSKKALRETQELSVTLLESDGAIVVAGSLLIKTGNQERLIRFIIQHAKALVVTSRIQTLSMWLQALPEETVSCCDWLLHWRAVCALIRSPLLARKDFILALEKFNRASNLTGQCLCLSGIIDSYIFERDDFKQLDPWIEQVAQREPLFNEQVPQEVMIRLTVSMFSALLHRAPQHPDYSVWLERIQNIPVNELPESLRVIKKSWIILHFIWKGDFHSARINHDLLEERLSEDSEVASRILWHLIHCSFLWAVAGDGHEALKIARKGLEVARERELKLWNPGLLAHAAAAALVTHNTDESGKFLDAVVALVSDSERSHLSFYHILRTVHCCLLNDLETASYHAKEALRYADIAGSPFYHAAAHSLHGQVCFMRGDLESARYHNLQTKAIGEQISSHFHQFHSILFEAILEWSEGKQTAALSLLRRSLRLAKQYNLIPGLWVCNEDLAKLLAEAIRNHIEVDYASLIITRRALMPALPPYDIESWPWLIRIHTLGRFEILISGHPIKPPSRARPKIFLFLKTLIALGGKEVREELISEIVWPDADGDVAHQLYTTTLFRLRKMLGSHEVLIHLDGRLSLNERLCWLDIWAFESIAEKLLSLLRSKTAQRESLRVHYDQLRGYCANFQAYDEYFPEVIDTQHEIQSKWIHILYLLADHWLQQRCLEDAKQCLEAIVSANQNEERAHRMLMDLHLSRGS